MPTHSMESPKRNGTEEEIVRSLFPIHTVERSIAFIQLEIRSLQTKRDMPKSACGTGFGYIRRRVPLARLAELVLDIRFSDRVQQVTVGDRLAHFFDSSL